MCECVCGGGYGVCVCALLLFLLLETIALGIKGVYSHDTLSRSLSRLREPIASRLSPEGVCGQLGLPGQSRAG